LYQFLLFLYVQAKNQSTITDVTLSHNKVECPYIRWNAEAWSLELQDSHIWDSTQLSLVGLY